MGDLSAHFSRSEFAEHGSGHLPAGMPTPDLVAALERLRADRGGRPLRIISGWRSAQHNHDIGGAPDSRHLHGDAADIEVGYATQRQAEHAGFTGIGVYAGWAVHVDTRPGARVVFADAPKS